jgi:hypothetical protein
MIQDQIYSLSKYFLNESNFNKSLDIEYTIQLQKQYKENKEHKEKQYKENKEHKEKQYKENLDLLFWAVYELFFEKQEHHLIYNKSKLEKDIKIELIEKIKYKGTRIKFENVQNNLLYENKLSYESLHLICIMNNTRLCIYNDEIILCLGLDGPIYYMKDFKFTDKPEQELYEIKHIYKPIKAVSGYKSDELKQMATQLNIEISNKQKMYECIYEKIDSFIKYTI